MARLSAARRVGRIRGFAVLGVGCLGCIFFFPALSRLLGQILCGALVAAAGLPAARWLEKNFSRPVSALLALGILILGGLGFIGLFLPHILAQFSLLIRQAPRLISLLRDAWDRLSQAEWLEKWGLTQSLQPESWLRHGAARLAESLPALLSKIGAGVDFLSQAFLAPVLGYYFLRDRETFCYQLSLWIPARHRKRVLTALREMRREAWGYIRGQMLVALSVAILTALGLLLAGIPAWLALGLMMGVCELIPYAGPIIGAIPIAVFALPQGLDQLLWGLGIAVAVQQIEGSFLSPRLMGGATGLHPVSVILLLSAGGLLWGLAGMMIALPLFLCLRGAARVFLAQGPRPQL